MTLQNYYFFLNNKVFISKNDVLWHLQEKYLWKLYS